MRRLAVVYSGEPTDQSVTLVCGANIAAARWFDAALSFHTYDEVHVFVSDERHAAMSQHIRQKRFDAVRVFPLSHAVQIVADTTYEAMHSPSGPILGQLRPLSSCSLGIPPVSAIHYTLSYPNLMDDVLRSLLLGAGPGDTMVALTSASREAHRKLYAMTADRFGIPLHEPRWNTLPIGVDLDVFSPPHGTERQHIRHVMQIPNDRFLVIVPGRLSIIDKSDVLSLLPYCARIVAENHKVLFLFAGDDSRGVSRRVDAFMRSRGYGDCVCLYRSPKPSEMALLYKAADACLVVSDSFQESYGIVISEAMAAGLPVVLPKWGPFPEVAGPNALYFDAIDFASTTRNWLGPVLDLIHPGIANLYAAQEVVLDLDQMVQHVLFLASHPLRCRHVSRMVRREAETRFNWKGIIRSYEDMWRDAFMQSRAANAITHHARLDFFSLFSHYYSTQRPDFVHPARLDNATPSAAEESATYLRSYPELGSYLSAEMMAKMTETDAPISMTGMDHVETRHAAWMAKHGLVRWR